MKIKLFDLLKGPDAWGNARGKAVGALLEEVILAHPEKEIFYVSFEGIERTDASFSRESVVEIANRFRMKKAIVITDLEDLDLIENLDLAAEKKKQPLFMWHGDTWRILGLPPTRSNVELLNYILSVPEATTASVSTEFDLKVTNASTKLKQLWESGYIIRREELAPSGGIEFIYYRIK